jgi:hypothetical protein
MRRLGDLTEQDWSIMLRFPLKSGRTSAPRLRSLGRPQWGNIRLRQINAASPSCP